MKSLQQHSLRRAFSRIGAEVRFRVPRWGRSGFSLDIERLHRKEIFVIFATNEVDFTVFSVEPGIRHLLLMVKDPAIKEVAHSKFLCGHDERHYFMAAIPERAGATSVRTAMTALKPKEVLNVETAAGIKPRYLHSRRRRLKNGERIFRQGEFMFVPRLDFKPASPLGIVRDEILTRERMRANFWGSSNRGNPHIAREAYRQTGTMVFVTHQYPGGLTKKERFELFQQDPAARRLYWWTQQRDPDVYVRGTIRHPEHATIDLGRIWHSVYVNTEGQSHAGRHLSFID